MLGDEETECNIFFEHSCFECGEKIKGAAIGCDGFTDYELQKTISFHPKCAKVVGERLISASLAVEKST